MIQYPDISGVLDDDRLAYRYVPVSQLHDEWPRLRHGLEVIKESNGEPWLPEDIYAALLYGRAALYIGEDSETKELEGFAIVEVMNFPYDFKQRLNLWIGYSVHPKQGHLGAEVVKRVARAMGIDSIVFSTTQESPWTANYKKLHTWYEV